MQMCLWLHAYAFYLFLEIIEVPFEYAEHCLLCIHLGLTHLPRDQHGGYSANEIFRSISVDENI